MQTCREVTEVSSMKKVPSMMMIEIHSRTDVQEQTQQGESLGLGDRHNVYRCQYMLTALKTYHNLYLYLETRINRNNIQLKLIVPGS